MGNLCVVTNGETDNERKGLIQGAVNSYLTRGGVFHALLLQQDLNELKIDNAFYSPYDRTRITAEIILQGRKTIRMKPKKEFREKYFGKYENKPLNKVDFASLFKYDEDIGLGEEMNDFILRVKNGVVKIKEEEKEKSTLLVTHPGPAAIIYCYFKDINIPCGEGFVKLMNSIPLVQEYNF